MKGVWTASYRTDWKKWGWPLPMDFGWKEGPYSVVYADPNAKFVLRPHHLIGQPVKLVITPSTGETHLDRKELQIAGIKVMSLLDDREMLNEIHASSEFTFFLILSALRHADRIFLDGKWERDENKLRGRELYSKMVGLVGHGRIGKNLEKWLRAFGAGVYWNDPYAKENIYQPSVEWMFRNCHVVVLCCSYNQETRGMIRPEHIRQMRPGAVLVNTARGEILDEDCVASALGLRPDVEYWTDVLNGEACGHIKASPMLKVPNVHVTPHIAGTTHESQEKAAKIALNLTREWLNANGEDTAAHVRVYKGE